MNLKKVWKKIVYKDKQETMEEEINRLMKGTRIDYVIHKETKKNEQRKRKTK